MIFGLVTPTGLGRSLSDKSAGEFADQQIRDLRGRNSGIFVVQIRLFREVLPGGEQFGLLVCLLGGAPLGAGHSSVPLDLRVIFQLVAFFHSLL